MLDWTSFQDLGRMHNLTVLSIYNSHFLDYPIELSHRLARAMARQYQEAGHFSNLRCLRLQMNADVPSIEILDHLAVLPMLEMLITIYSSATRRPGTMHRYPSGEGDYRPFPAQPDTRSPARRWVRKSM